MAKKKKSNKKNSCNTCVNTNNDTISKCPECNMNDSSLNKSNE